MWNIFELIKKPINQSNRKEKRIKRIPQLMRNRKNHTIVRIQLLFKLLPHLSKLFDMLPDLLFRVSVFQDLNEENCQKYDLLDDKIT